MPYKHKDKWRGQVRSQGQVYRKVFDTKTIGIKYEGGDDSPPTLELGSQEQSLLESVTTETLSSEMSSPLISGETDSSSL